MKLAIFSDCHIGEYSEGWVDPETKLNTRLLDTLAIWDWITQIARSEKADAIVFAGDRFRLKRPPSWIRDLADRKVRDISEAGIPLYLLVGNHDMYDKAGTWDSYNGLRVWDAPVHIINEPSIYPLEGVNLVFLPYGFREEWPACLSDIVAEEKINILFFHDDVKDISNYGSFTAKEGIPKEWIDCPEWDLVLGGHIHKRQELPLERTDGFHIGSPLDLAQDGPQGAKGALILTLSTDPKKVEVEFVESPAPKIIKKCLGANEEWDLSDVKGNIIQLEIEEGNNKIRHEWINRLRSAEVRSASVSIIQKKQLLVNQPKIPINATLPLLSQLMEWGKTKTNNEKVLWQLQKIIDEE